MLKISKSVKLLVKKKNVSFILQNKPRRLFGQPSISLNIVYYPVRLVRQTLPFCTEETASERSHVQLKASQRSFLAGEVGDTVGNPETLQLPLVGVLIVISSVVSSHSGQARRVVGNHMCRSLSKNPSKAIQHFGISGPHIKYTNTKESL